MSEKHIPVLKGDIAVMKTNFLEFSFRMPMGENGVVFWRPQMAENSLSPSKAKESRGPSRWVLQHYVDIAPFSLPFTVEWYQKGGSINNVPKNYRLNKQTACCLQSACPLVSLTCLTECHIAKPKKQENFCPQSSDMI